MAIKWSDTYATGITIIDEQHKELHDDFISDCGGLKQRFEAEGPSLSFVTNINKIVVEWLIRHIGRVDKEMSGFLLDRIRNVRKNHESNKTNTT